MTGILLTKSSTFIIGPVAQALGYIMNAIFTLLEKIGIPSTGLAIILLTIIFNLCMLPLTYKQQKFSKLSAKMNPELQAIQKKYKNKRDNDSVMKMNEETQAVYRKYGVSPTGSCVQILIQFPVMIALYNVINNIPAYVTNVKNTFMLLVDKLVTMDGATEILQGFKNASRFSKQFSNEAFIQGSSYMKDTFIDVLNKASSAEWLSLEKEFPAIADTVRQVSETLGEYNYFLGLNIADSPSYIIGDAWSSGAYGLAIGALCVPILAALTQYINYALMPQPQNSGNEQADAMAASMKSMNTVMPIMSAVFCFTLPTGLGLYWISGAVIRGISQVVINRHINKIDFDEMIRINTEKEKERAKNEKKTVAASTVNKSARMNTKYLASTTGLTQEEKEAIIEKAKAANKKEGSIAAKANMVRDYNEKNKK